MDNKFRSLLDELVDYVPYENREQFIATRAQQVVASFENLRNLINESYEPELAEELTKRLLNAAKSGDDRKFVKKIDEVKRTKHSGRGK